MGVLIDLGANLGLRSSLVTAHQLPVAYVLSRFSFVPHLTLERINFSGVRVCVHPHPQLTSMERGEMIVDCFILHLYVMKDA